MRPAATGALLVSAVFLLAGCSSGSVVEPPQRSPSEPSEEAQADAHGELACDDRTLRQIDQTIGGQLEAFADEDYAAALRFASAGFQEQFDEESFREVIEASFPDVADATGHTSGVCVHRGDDAQLLVIVESEVSQLELVYQMVLEDDEWRIDGAVPADANPSTSEPIEV